MYTPDEIKNMTTDQRRQALEDLAAEFFQSQRWKTDFARSVGMFPQALSPWFRDSEPPVWAILLVQSWIKERHLTNAVRSRDARIKSAQEALKSA